MSVRTVWRTLSFVVLSVALILPGSVFVVGGSAQAGEFADPAFERVWAEADSVVASGEVSRSWLWGPQPIGVGRDYYEESTAPERERLVQYFDKSRMEITYPDGNSSSIWYVTNGLLVTEMTSGRQQLGDNLHFELSPAEIPVAGDLNYEHTPTFADFTRVASLDGSSNRSDDRTGEFVDHWINAQGNVSTSTRPVDVELAYYEPTLGHNIPSIFWNWLSDPANGITTYGSWIYPMGLPISEAYWVTTQVGGTEKYILVQLYERRVLTYTPDNAPEWQVEMGNVGRAYLQWAKPGQVSNPVWSPDGESLAFSSRVDGNFEIFTIDADGSGLFQVTNSPYGEFVTDWVGDGSKILYTRAGQDWSVNPDGTGAVQSTLQSPLWSPDGQKVSYLQYPGDGETAVEIWVQDAGGGNNRRLFASNVFDVDRTWSPDSEKLALDAVDTAAEARTVELTVLHLDGTGDTSMEWVDTIHIDVSWSGDSSQLVVTQWTVDDRTDLYIAQADGSGRTPLLAGLFIIQGRNAQWSPTDDRIVMEYGNPGAPQGIWAVNTDSSELLQLTELTTDADPLWSPDGNNISFMRTGFDGPELWIMRADGSDERVLQEPMMP